MFETLSHTNVRQHLRAIGKKVSKNRTSFNYQIERNLLFVQTGCLKMMQSTEKCGKKRKTTVVHQDINFSKFIVTNR